MRHASHDIISLDEAFRIVDEAAAGITLSRRRMAVRQSTGQVLAADQVSKLSLPPFDKSAMDGYAVREGDVRDAYRVLETVAAGSTPTAALAEGTAVKVMTGAPVPPGTGQVIPVEDVCCHGDTIEVIHRPAVRHICPQGEDVRPGMLVLRAGTRLGPLEIANLIGCGITEVEVLRPVRLAIISTGDEIADDPRDLGPGKIMNTNGPLLALLGDQWSMEVVSQQSVRDDRRQTGAAIAAAVQRADITVLSGGVSVGDFDFVGSGLADAGLEVHFSAVAIKPGRPLTFATKPGRLVFGLPGNPVSVYLMFYVFVLRAAARMAGSPAPMREYTLALGREFRRHRTERQEYVPCRIDDDGRLVPVEFHGSAHLTAILEADGFFAVPVGEAVLEAGRNVRFMPTARGWR
jgi:molybdopterin molybdotransferase